MKHFFKKLYEENILPLFVLYFIIKLLFILVRRYKKIKAEIKEALAIFESPNTKKSYLRKQYRKLVVYRYIYSIRPTEYYLFDFEKNSFEDREKFITRQQTARYYSVINNKKFKKILDKKNLCYKVFKKYYKRDLICIRNEEDKDELFEFLKKHNEFILKPFAGHSGEGIEIIRNSNFSNYDEMFEYLISKAPFVAEELIKQSSDLGCFHEQSVNTIRVVTFQYKGDLSILWTFLRVGQGDNEVDNMGAAGIGALIDQNTGIIISDGVDWKGSLIEKHPDSNITFKGFQIPRWNELIETVKELASELSEMHCIGWDLALTSDGWVLVEGNARPQCVTIQTFTKKGYKNYYERMYNLVKQLHAEERALYAENNEDNEDEDDN